MSADLLRRAATALRERAGKATPGPWVSDGDGDVCSDASPEQPEVGWGKVKTAGNAPYFALLHPPVAQALAATMERVAWCLRVDAHLIGRIGYEELVGVARAVLREPEETS